MKEPNEIIANRIHNDIARRRASRYQFGKLIWWLTIIAICGLIWFGVFHACTNQASAETGDAFAAKQTPPPASELYHDPVYSFIAAYIGNRVGYGNEITPAIQSAATEWQIDPLLLMAIIQTESTFNVDARGKAGEIGLMQVHPGWVRHWGATAGIRIDGDIWQPSVNVSVGAQILKRNYEQGDYVAALAGYNGSRAYALKVDKRYREITHGFRLWCVRGGK